MWKKCASIAVAVTVAVTVLPIVAFLRFILCVLLYKCVCCQVEIEFFFFFVYKYICNIIRSERIWLF